MSRDKRIRLKKEKRPQPSGKTARRMWDVSPMMVPVASVVLIWQVVFHYNGTLNAVLSTFGISPVDWLNSPYCQVVIIILFLWKNLGYNMILFMAALNGTLRDHPLHHQFL